MLATAFTRNSYGARTPEQHFALIGDVAEKRALGEPRPTGDRGHRGLVKAALHEELQGRLLQPASHVAPTNSYHQGL